MWKNIIIQGLWQIVILGVILFKGNFFIYFRKKIQKVEREKEVTAPNSDLLIKTLLSYLIHKLKLSICLRKW